MRKITMGLAVAAVAALTVPVAASAAPVQDFSMSVSPNKMSTKAKPVPITLSFSTGTRETTPNVQPPTTKRSEVLFPAGAQWNGGLFPKCSAATITAAKTTDDCPSGSILGKGSAAGLANAETPSPLVQSDIKITAVNGGKAGLNLFVEGSAPLKIQSNLSSKFTKISQGSYGLKLSLELPNALQEPVPGTLVAVTKFQVKVGAKRKVNGKTRGIIEVYKCTGKWKATGTFFFRDGSKLTGKDEASCRKR